MSDTAPPAAGWYADPENPAGERWWNGSGWSDHRRDSTVAPAAPDRSGFVFGAGVPGTGDGRTDPYAPPTQPSYGTPTPSGYSPYIPAPYGAPAYGSRTNGLALAGLIVSAVGWVVIPLVAGIAGIILSGFGLTEAKRREAAGNPNSGRGLALAGLIVGIVVTSIGLIFVLFYLGMMATVMNTGYTTS